MIICLENIIVCKNFVNIGFTHLSQEEKKKKREREQLENAASAPVEPFTLSKPVEVRDFTEN